MFEDFRLKVFLTVAANGSFTKAATDLGVSQPAVSQNIAELEKITGTKLFERLKGEVHLTESGEVFRGYAEKMLKLGRSVDRAYTSVPDSVVRIYISKDISSAFISPALDAFSRLHTNVAFFDSVIEEADLIIKLQKSGYLPSENSIGRIVSYYSPLSAFNSDKPARGVAMTFDLLYLPSDLFAIQELNYLIRNFLTDYFENI